MIARQVESEHEMCIGHNYLVNQTVTFSPLNLNLNLKQHEALDKHLLAMYRGRFRHVQCDAKHHIFLPTNAWSWSKGEMVKGIMRETEVQINDSEQDIAHSMKTSIEVAIWQWVHHLKLQGNLLCKSNMYHNAERHQVVDIKYLSAMWDMAKGELFH